jgi:8-oxo-dGTP pyrophosphatase MutT (NUDIX family)
MVWKPNVTVAAMVHREGRFLLVEEHTDLGVRLNQPAGHLEDGESLLAACVRETMEETAHMVEPTALLGIYQWGPPDRDLTYLRFTFIAEVTGVATGRALDTGIIGAVWLTPDELEAQVERHRSPLVMQCVTDFLAGRSYSLDLIRHYE